MSKKLTSYQKRMKKAKKIVKSNVKRTIAPKLLKILKECNSAVALDCATYKHQEELEDFRLKVARAYHKATQNDDSLINAIPGLRLLVNTVSSIG